MSRVMLHTADLADVPLRTLVEWLRDGVPDGSLEASTTRSPAFTPERLRVLIDGLAQVVDTCDRALLLARRADFPVEMTPPFSTPLAFWSTVVAEAHKGALVGGVRPILEQAVALYPGNTTLAQYLREIPP